MGYLTAQETAELMADVEKKIDAVKARRFFKHIFRNDEIKDLDVPQIYMPKTLTTLISVGYASSSAPVPSSQSSNNSSLKELSKVVSKKKKKKNEWSKVFGASRQSSNNSSLKEWSKVFGEDGRLRFDQILSLFPSSDDLTKLEFCLYKQSLCHAHFALSSYQKKHGTEFELVAPVLSYVFICMEPLSDLAYVNFFAKPKNSDSAPDLFFAEMVACGTKANEVIKCCILPPRPSPVALTFEFVKVWLPLDEEDKRPAVRDYSDSD